MYFKKWGTVEGTKRSISQGQPKARCWQNFKLNYRKRFVQKNYQENDHWVIGVYRVIGQMEGRKS